ncbi:MAG: hypothetical protein ACLFQV_00765 [Vulcanimicrobiota bacterium]
MNFLNLGFPLMNMGQSKLPSMQNFFNSNVANHFLQPSPPPLPGMGELPTKNVDMSAFADSPMVPGIGLASLEMPQAPSPMDFMELQQLQAEHKQEQNEFASEFKDDINSKRREIFTQNHYQFDKNGKPVMDENGKPKLFEGKESREQRSLRGDWEKSVKKELKTKQKAEAEVLEEKAKALFKEIHENGTDFLDPEKAEMRQQQMEALEKEEKEMMIRHDKEQIDVVSGHLPDPDSKQYQDLMAARDAREQAEEKKKIEALAQGKEYVPDNTLREVKVDQKMGSFIDKGFNDYKQLLADHKAAEENSPEGQAIMNYFEEIKEFTQRQREWMAQFKANMGFGDDFSMDLPEQYRSKYNYL